MSRHHLNRKTSTANEMLQRVQCCPHSTASCDLHLVILLAPPLQSNSKTLELVLKLLTKTQRHCLIQWRCVLVNNYIQQIHTIAYLFSDCNNFEFEKEKKHRTLIWYVATFGVDTDSVYPQPWQKVLSLPTTRDIIVGIYITGAEFGWLSSYNILK